MSHLPPSPARPAHRTLAAVLACFAIGGCSSDAGTTLADGDVVNIYNWADYFAPDTIRRFEEETGIRVNLDLYDTSQMVDVKLLAGNSGYDVVIHSSQYSSRLAPIGVYESLDMTQLPNTAHLDQALIAKTDVYEATRGYAVPYHWGTTGYAYNVQMVRDRLGDHPLDSADVLFDPAVVSKLADCGVTLLDGSTDLFPMVLAYLGRNPNSVLPEDIDAAEAQLSKVRPYIRYFGNQKMIIDLPNQEVCMAMSWAGEYRQARNRAREAGLDVEISYTVPKEGSGLWVDALYMPADAPNKANGYRFLNFLMRPDVAADIANTVGYANSNAAARPMMLQELLDDPAVYPDETIWPLLYPVLPADPKQERYRTRAFARVKSGI